jgi:carboxymethylenebutenolidase
MPDQHWTRLAADGGEMRAHVSLPSEGVGFGAGVVIVHGGWGIENALLLLPKRLCYAGYAAIIPDMYHRETPAQAEEKPQPRIARLTWAGAKRDIETAAEHLRANGVNRMAILGFCMGGALAFMGAASMEFQTGVLFYPHEVFGPFGADGVVPFDLAPQLKIPVLGHFGVEDKNPSQADMQRLDAALTAQGTPHQFYSYEGAGHGFAVAAEGRNSYRPIPSNIAYDRTIGWFDRQLRNVPAHA